MGTQIYESILRSNKNFSLISHPLSPTFIVCQSDREMSGTPCEPANLLLFRNLEMDFSTYMDPTPDDGNKDRIVNEDNDKAQEPEMHQDIAIHDEGNKIKKNNMIAKDKEGAPEELKEPTRDITQNKKQGKKTKDKK